MDGSESQATVVFPCDSGPGAFVLDCYGDVSMHLNVLAHMTIGDWVGLSIFVLFILFAKSKVRR